MKFRTHLHLFYLSTTLWTWFFIGGLWSNYYQNLSSSSKIVFLLILPSFCLQISGKALLKSLTKDKFFYASIVCSMYFSLTFLTYDFIYLKLFLKKDLSYLFNYWYLTLFTPIPFLILLPIGYRLDRGKV